MKNQYGTVPMWIWVEKERNRMKKKKNRYRSSREVSTGARGGKQLLSILVFLCVCCLLTGIYGVLKSGTVPFSFRILKPETETERPSTADGIGKSDVESQRETADTETETTACPETTAESTIATPDGTGAMSTGADRPMEPLPKETTAESKVEHETRDSATPIQTVQLMPEGYDYTMPVPDSGDPVGDDYFADAVFLGDSRMEGFALQCGLSNITCYAYKGLTTESVFTSEVINKNGGKVTAMDALRDTEFAKVYIMLGINETGWAKPEAFPQCYGKIVDAIREIRPDTVIYVMSIIPVAKSVSDTHEYVKNDKINLYNSYLREMCAEKEVFYIDLGFMAGEDGALPEGAARDGIHVGYDLCKEWLAYLRTHVVPVKVTTSLETDTDTERIAEEE